jgi:hypothetical protein
VDESPQERYALLARAMQQEADDSVRFNRLFAQNTLDLSLRLSIDPLDRAMLEEIIDSCLSHPTSLGHDKMGNVVLLVNPDEQTYMYLCSHDGLLFLPCYQLKLQSSILESDD